MIKKNIKDMFITALESGYSDYWMYIPVDKKDLKFVRENRLPMAEYLWKNIWAGQAIKVFDAEEESDFLGKINPENIKRGVKLFKSQFEDKYDNASHGDFDAEDADILMQLIVMGEIVYG